MIKITDFVISVVDEFYTVAINDKNMIVRDYKSMLSNAECGYTGGRGFYETIDYMLCEEANKIRYKLYNEGYDYSEEKHIASIKEELRPVATEIAKKVFSDKIQMATKMADDLSIEVMGNKVLVSAKTFEKHSKYLANGTFGLVLNLKEVEFVYKKAKRLLRG